MVRAPFWVPGYVIQKYIEDKSDWIRRHLAATEVNKYAKKYIEGEKHLFFGREYPLKLETTDSPTRTSVELLEDHILVRLYEGHGGVKKNTEIKDGLLRWYLESGISVITEKVNRYTGAIGVDYSQIDIKKVSSIWGSCSPGNRLCFNRKLIMAPHEVVDYVVIHEVCHLVHRNHSSRFWGLVAKFDPKYKEHRRWLRRNHHLMTI